MASNLTNFLTYFLTIENTPSWLQLSRNKSQEKNLEKWHSTIGLLGLSVDKSVSSGNVKKLHQFATSALVVM